MIWLHLLTTKKIDVLRAETKTSSLEEQRELLQSLTQQLKAAVNKDTDLAENIKGLDLFDEQTSSRLRQIEADNSQGGDIGHKQGSSANQTHQQQDQSAEMSL